MLHCNLKMYLYKKEETTHMSPVEVFRLHT